MERHDSRDLDGVVDEVARALTSARLARDLRPAIAARIAARPAWPMGWRVAAAGVAIAALVAVVVVSRSGHEQQPVQVARVVTASPSVAPRADVPVEGAKSEAAFTPDDVIRTRGRALGRQTIVAATVSPGTVDIRPLAVVPFEADPLVPLEAVEIAPIDVEQVRIAEFGAQVE